MAIKNCPFIIVQDTIRFFDDIELENCHFLKSKHFDGARIWFLAIVAGALMPDFYTVLISRIVANLKFKSIGVYF